MDLLDKKQHYIILFDFYENLLTKKQREYFMEYYFSDLSLSEIANIHNVSRNAVFDSINKVYNLLEEYENKLNLYNKFIQRNKIFDEYSLNAEMQEMIQKLKNIE